MKKTKIIKWFVICSMLIGFLFPTNSVLAYDDETPEFTRADLEIRWLMDDVVWMNNIIDGRARVMDYDNKYGFVDISGQAVIPIEYDSAYDFSEGLAAVLIDGQWGYIDTEGRVVIEPKYVAVGSFSEGKACVAIDADTYGIINKKGELLYETKENTLYNFDNGMLLFYNKKKELYGYLDKNLKEVIKPKYKDAYFFNCGLAKAQNKKGKWFYIDKKGRKKIANKKMRNCSALTVIELI